MELSQLRPTVKNNIIVVDDFIPLSLQEKYKELLINSGATPWYFLNDITSMDNNQFRPALSHLIYDDGRKISDLEVDILAHLGAEKYGWKFNGLAQAKTLLQLPLNPTVIGDKLDHLHVDFHPYHPHLVVLYYVIDADGDTIITESKYDGKQPTTIKFDNQKVIAKVTPKQGRAVLFDGSHYHTAEQPKNGLRCIINLNIY